MTRRPLARHGIGRMAAQGVVVAILIAALYWPFLNLRTLTTGGDMLNLFYPTFGLARNSIAETGIFALWNPYEFCGHPFAAAAQSAVFYPPGRALYAALGDAPVAAMNLFILGHLLLAGLGAWAFARSRTGLGLRGWAGPMCAGLVFVGSAWWWGQVEHAAALATTSWLPWLVWAGGRVGRRFSMRGVAAFALVFFLQLAAGHPQEAFYSLLGAGAWAFWNGWRRGQGSLKTRALGVGGAAARIGLGCALAGVLASIQLLPTFELSAHSYRRFDGPDYAAQFSMPVSLLKLLILPHAHGSYADGYDAPMAYNEYGIYVGTPALVLALWALGWWAARGLRRRRRSRTRSRNGMGGLAGLWATVAVGAILLALGGNADLRRILAPGRIDTARPAEFPEPGWSPLALMARLIPPVRHFRAPSRILVLWSFAAALLAGMGIRAVEVGWRWRAGGSGGKNPKDETDIKDAKELEQRNRNPGVNFHHRGTETQRRSPQEGTIREDNGSADTKTPRNGWRPRWSVGFGAACLGAVFLSLFLPSLRERMAFQCDYPNALAMAEERRFRVPNERPLDNRVYRLTLLDDELLARDGTAPTPSPGDPDLDMRVAIRASILAPDTNLLAGVAILQGYEEGLLPTVRYKDFLFTFNRHFRDANPDARLLALGGARWIWSELPVTSAQWEPVKEGRGGGELRGGAIGTLYRNTLWRGAAFDKSDFPEVDWAALEGTYARGGKLMLQRNGVRIPYTNTDEHGRTRTNTDAATPPRWTVEAPDVNTLVCRRVETGAGSGTKAEAGAESEAGGESGERQSLIVAQSVYPGWVARDAEGRRLSLKALNAWNTEIVHAPEQTEIRLAYEPWSFRLGAFVSALGLAVLAFLTIVGRRGRRSE